MAARAGDIRGPFAAAAPTGDFNAQPTVSVAEWFGTTAVILELERRAWAHPDQAMLLDVVGSIDGFGWFAA